MKKTIYISTLIFINLFLLSNKSHAACIQNPNFNNLQRYLSNKVFNIQYDDTTYKSLGTIDTSILSTGTNAHSGSNADCSAWQVGQYLNSWSPTNGIAPTNIPGIGIRVKVNTITTWFPFRGAYAPNNSWGFPGGFNWNTEIIKTGQVTSSGVIRNGQLARFSQENSKVGTTFILSTLNIPANAIRINVLSCSLKNSQSVYNINMRDWYDTQFQNIGDASAPVDIPIALTCLAGTNIKATVTSTAGYVDAATGKLALSGADKATGIAIQLLDKNNTPIKLNTLNSLQNNVPSGEYMFGWKARYIKTASSITPGSANTTATVNIRYE